MSEIFVVLAAVVLVIIFITQLILPFVQGTPFFPMIRKSVVATEVTKTERELAETTELVQLNTKLEDAKAKLAQLQQPKEPTK